MSTMVEGQVTGFVCDSEEARDPDRSLHDAALSVDGRTIATRSQRSAFTLVTPSGERISVETDASTQLLPREEKTDSWSELLAHPLSSLFEREAPGDHVEATLAWTSVTPGARIAVHGTEERSLVNEGYRGTQDAARTIRATAIATGDSAGALLNHWHSEQRAAEAPAPPAAHDTAATRTPQGQGFPVLPPLLMLSVGCVLIALAAMSLGRVFRLGDARPEMQAFIFWILAVTSSAYPIYWIRTQQHIPWFTCVTGDNLIAPGAPRRAGSQQIMFWVMSWGMLTFLAALLLFALTVFLPSGPIPALPTGLVCTITALISGWCAVRLYLYERPHARALRVLLGARTYESGTRGSSTLELSILRGSLHRKRREYLKQIRVSPARHAWKAQTWTKSQEAPLIGRTADGSNVELRCQEGIFGTRIRRSGFSRIDAWIHEIDPSGMSPEELAQAMIDGARNSRVKDAELAEELNQDEGKCITEEWILPGSSLLVLARFREENGVLVAESTGPESLMMFGAPEDARKSARRELFKHYAGVGGLALLTISTLLIGWVSPFFWA